MISILFLVLLITYHGNTCVHLIAIQDIGMTPETSFQDSETSF